MWSYFIRIYLWIHQIYFSIYQFFLRLLGPVYFVYYIDNAIIKNITLHYYAGIGMDRYSSGKYFCKIIAPDSTNHFIHDGNIHEISASCSLCDSIMAKENITRKNIILFNENSPVEIDLNILDNYYHRIDPSKEPIDLKMIISCLGFQCTHIHFIELMPFHKKIIPIDDINIHDIYEIKE